MIDQTFVSGDVKSCIQIFDFANSKMLHMYALISDRSDHYTTLIKKNISSRVLNKISLNGGGVSII